MCFNGNTFGFDIIPASSRSVLNVLEFVDLVTKSIEEFIDFASNHEELKFYVTRIGCGIAGFRDEEIAPLFRKALDKANIILPETFYKILTN